MQRKNPPGTYHQGDVSFTPIGTFGRSVADIDTAAQLRLNENHLVLLEGEITGHHHGFWFGAKPVQFHDAALAHEVKSALPAIQHPARLYRDDKLVSQLPLRRGAPVIGFLVLDEPMTLRHASIAGVPTLEHDDLRLPKGGYLVTGKQEQVAGDIRAVAD